VKTRFKNLLIAALFLVFLLKTFNAFADNGQSLIDFKQTILPILKDSCFACHAPGAGYVGTDPVVAKKIKKEIGDSLDDFPMGDQFPFPDAESVAKQLKHLDKELSKNLMPPEAQAKLGLGLPLSDKNRKILLNWVDQQKKTAQ